MVVKRCRGCEGCIYKKDCTAKDWKEHAFKCESCIWNKNSLETKRFDWPRRVLIAGMF